MMYKDFYKSVQNPLEKENFIDKLLEAYMKPDDLYFAVADINAENKKVGKYFSNFRSVLEITLFNTWKESLLKLASTSDDKALKDFASYVNQFDPKTATEVQKSRELINNKYKFKLFEYDYKAADDENWRRIRSDLIQIDDSYNQKTMHRLYLNIDPALADIVTLRLIKKCTNKGIGYNFKYDEYGDRADSFVIYCDTKHLPIYTEMLQEIKDELANSNFDVNDYIYEPHLLTGVIDGWIGYGSEPSYEDNLSMDKKSYNCKRAMQLQKILNQEMNSWFSKSKNRFVRVNGKKMLYPEYFVQEIIQRYQEESGPLEKDFEEDLKQELLYYYNGIVNELKYADSKDDYMDKFSVNNRIVSIPNTLIIKVAKDLFKEAADNLPYIKEDIMRKIEASSVDNNITTNYAFDTYALRDLVKAEAELNKNMSQEEKNVQKTRRYIRKDNNKTLKSIDF